MYVYAHASVVSDEQGGVRGYCAGLEGGADMGAAGEGPHAVAMVRAGRRGAGFGYLGSGMDIRNEGMGGGSAKGSRHRRA